YRDLVERYGLSIADEITTDAKVIPTLVSRRLGTGSDIEEAFRATVSEFDGSVAIGAVAAQSPTRLMLAMRGSGQALYVGVAPGQFVVASEPYGVVEECPRSLRMDGESTVDGGGNPVPSGQIVILDAALAGEEAGITRLSYDGSPLPVAAGEFRTAEITTRDFDLRGYPPFLRKEIEASPVSLRTTGLAVRALPATELSGFEMTSDMSDVLAVAVSQSGTTTDTNRTVDLIRSRGAAVIAIVNRRGSDLSHKADGVFYTSDGRDVEMSVASTKAFYAQVAPGQLLGLALADAAACG